MFHNFFSSLARSTYLSCLLLSHNFILWLAGTAKFTGQQAFHFLIFFLLYYYYYYELEYCVWCWRIGNIYWSLIFLKPVTIEVKSLRLQENTEELKRLAVTWHPVKSTNLPSINNNKPLPYGSFTKQCARMKAFKCWINNLIRHVVLSFILMLYISVVTTS